MNDALDLARLRLKAFRGDAPTDRVLDAVSGLTAGDVDALLAACRAPTDLEPGGSLDIDDLSGNA
ncbi:hypothetical protein [Sphingomonas sp. Y38-1Y]|uniref:hypothetical protein n=1 Tax=Sphingomonas sp. Y38-1Y TaxID=3078265 RepID=UPI0028EBEA23|nr:hypothetical protein [Sphingomonas sp. Y38-1Y]